MLLTYNLQTYYYISHQVHKKSNSNTDPTLCFWVCHVSIANCRKLKIWGTEMFTTSFVKNDPLK
jgi:hypothetical protein